MIVSLFPVNAIWVNSYKPRWAKLVLTDEGIDRRYYELCALSELKNALRSGDVWVQGSRQFKDSTNTWCRSRSSPP